MVRFALFSHFIIYFEFLGFAQIFEMYLYKGICRTKVISHSNQK